MPLAVCATPIGNLGDVTLRVLEELREAEVVLCEDTRHTRRLLDRHGISARLVSLHEHNEAERVGRAPAAARGRGADGSRLGRWNAGDLGSGRLAGSRRVRCRRAGNGASGALGRRDGPRRERIRGGAVRLRRVPAEAGVRARSRMERAAARCGRWLRSSRRGAFRASLRSLAAAMPDRPVAVCRELTKLFEEVVRGPAAELAARFAEPPRRARSRLSWGRALGGSPTPPIRRLPQPRSAPSPTSLPPERRARLQRRSSRG